MAGTSLMITFVSFTIIVGINSETFDLDGSHITRETSIKDGVKNFTQSLTSTSVDGIITVDRTVELTDNMTNAKISTDHSITTTNKGVVTLDHTLEKFGFYDNLILHDHFFNISSSNRVTTGRNCTSVDHSDNKIIEYVKVTDGNNLDRIIHVTNESLTEDQYNDINRIRLIYKTDGLKEIHNNKTSYSAGQLRSVDNMVAFINNSEYTVDYSITNYRITHDSLPDHWFPPTNNSRYVATFHDKKLTTVDTNTTTIDQSTNSTRNRLLIVTLDDEGGKNITYIDEVVKVNGIVVSKITRNAKLNASGKCFSSDCTCELKDIEDMRYNADSYIKEATERFNSLGTIEGKAKKESQDLMERKYKCSK